MNRLPKRLAVGAATLLALGAASAVLAVDSSGSSSSSSAAASAPGHRWHGARRALLVGTLLRATHQLGTSSPQLALNSQQQQQIKSLLMQARSARQSAAAQAPDLTVLGNPGDPNYASAVQGLKSRSDQRLDEQSTLAQSIYNVLTPDQQKALPGVLSNMKAKAEARRAAWRAQHPTASTSGG